MGGREKGKGVVVTEDSALPAQRLFLEFPGLRVVPSPTRSWASWLAEVRVSEWSSPRMRRRRVSVSSSSERARWWSPSHHRFSARLLAEVRVSG